MEKSKIVAMIPARIGSTRLKMKNLALIDGKPMIYYTIKAAQESGVFDRIVLNSDSDVFEKIAERYGVEFYRRPEHLGSSTTKSDDVVLDFMEKHPSEIVAWVNPTSPLQTGKEVAGVMNHFVNEQLDSLITVKDEQVHSIFNNEPINFSLTGKFAQTQDLTPVQPFVYSVMAWRVAPFVERMKQEGFAFFVGKVGYYPVSKLSGVIIKTESDLRMADYIMKSIRLGETELEYDELVQERL